MPLWSRWNEFDFFGAPYVWSSLHNFGGNTGMWGSFETLNNGTFFAYEHSKAIQGTGFCPEGIDQNPAYYQFLLDLNWMQAPEDPSFRSWATQYTLERYGEPLSSAQQAWDILMQTVYGTAQPIDDPSIGGFWGEKSRDALSSCPFCGAEDVPQPDWYNVSDVFEAWGLLADAAAASETFPRTLRYDLVNVGREVSTSRCAFSSHFPLSPLYPPPSILHPPPTPPLPSNLSFCSGSCQALQPPIFRDGERYDH